MSEPTPTPPAPPTPALLRPREAARYLAVSEKTLGRLALPRVRLGPRAIAYCIDDLRQFIAQRRECGQ